MIAIVLLMVLPAFAGATVGGQDGPVSLSEYRDRLRSIQEAVERQDVAAARAGARSLRALRVRHDGMDLAPDATVLEPLAKATDAAAARESLGPLRALRSELESIDAGPAPPPPDGALFERLRQEEAERQRSPDGNVGGPALHAPEIPRSLLDRLYSFLEALGKQITRFLNWLVRLFFGGGGAASQAPSTRYLVAGLVVTVLGTLGIAAVLALRRRHKATTAVAVSEAPAMSAKDDDPLSRTATEWERFAAELMKAGRFREAIRAWYHAVLVSLFRSGALHYRRDRTNWEYAYALPSTVPWRSGFMDATRTFEQEWYGRRDTPVETAEIYQGRALRMLAEVREGVAR